MSRDPTPKELPPEGPLQEGPGPEDRPSPGAPAARILEAWVDLEKGLRAALPFCSVQPPTQPAELLAALRINHRIGPEEDSRIMALREIRNRVAHDPEEPSEEETQRFEAEAQELMGILKSPKGDSC